MRFLPRLPDLRGRLVVIPLYLLLAFLAANRRGSVPGGPGVGAGMASTRGVRPPSNTRRAVPPSAALPERLETTRRSGRIQPLGWRGELARIPGMGRGVAGSTPLLWTWGDHRPRSIGARTTLTTEMVKEDNDVPVPNWLRDCQGIHDKGHEQALRDGTVKTFEEWEETARIWRAFAFAYALHDGQYRKSGAPYIIHPIAVASLIRELGGDPRMIAAGFLHDVVEDTDVTSREIGDMFGAEVRRLVEGVTNLSKVDFCNREDFQAENFRKMFNSMAQDIRVIIIKLADRLHNMRTLQHLSSEKQKRIALETMDIYAPLASRLGLWRMKCFLEDLSFKYLEPDGYTSLKVAMAGRAVAKESRIREAKAFLKTKLDQLQVPVIEYQTRFKHLYSVWNKMHRDGKSFQEIDDIASIRIIVPTRTDCYMALAGVHETFTPIPGRLKDHVALPKPNGYQSIHTEVLGLHGQQLEIQIRTAAMHNAAEFGIASEWKFGGRQTSPMAVAGGGAASNEKLRWLRQVLDWQNQLKDSPEYYKCLKENLFEDEVYVFTPRGDVLTLKKASTAVDFAYKVHTEIGNRVCACRINGKESSLDKELHDGDIVEIMTCDDASPSLQWLNFAKTPAARNGIRKWFKGARMEENTHRARQLLAEELGVHLDRIISSEAMAHVSDSLGQNSTQELLVALGSGEVLVSEVVGELQTHARRRIAILAPPLPAPPTIAADPAAIPAAIAATLPAQYAPRQIPVMGGEVPPPGVEQGVLAAGGGYVEECKHVKGLDGYAHGFSWCCRPLPGEPIIGVMGVNGERQGVVQVHHQNCVKAKEAIVDDLVPLRWERTTQPTQVDIVVECIDRIGIMRDIIALFSDHHVPLNSAVCIVHKGTNTASARLSVGITDVTQLNQITDRIRTLGDVFDVRRVVTSPRPSSSSSFPPSSANFV